ncbi:velum formation-related protein [Vermiconidia calcicola]|uniref:Velum formation-related protein n=1 Tax=Vermiconidia calcicola TaxID=1690605 RepID=A0ACC3NMJ6_9PEZI|nr:velum formation-related protein [Vermiconidia calcicola]
MEGPGVRPVENETKSQASRTTKEGKKFTYRLNVLQQPLRARACGSGAKSSADRRPVDPPPIVELKIFEGGETEQRDVTFSMNANYFLFATLEQARNVAHGRVAQDQSRLTVLTGTPVAGMVCLDRPSPAGYFIFPDLSVRHEGKYRLSFSLYEELKEAKDEDQNDELAKPNGAGDAHVTHRLEVKSVPFTVYSAKKFPGLTESTSLSRMVAEQGCRVRIRRDVRMRRRDPKSGKDWDGYEEETAEARARMSATPEAPGYSTLPTPHGYMDPISRPRSGSNASHHSLAPSLSALSRRPSQQELNQSYHQPSYGTAPHTPQSAYPQSSPYGPSPSQSYSQAPFIQQQSAMQPPPPQYQQQTYQPPPGVPHAPPSHGYYGYASAGAPPPPTSQAHLGAPPAPYESQEHQQRMSIDYAAQMSNDHRRSSAHYAPPPPPLSTYSSYTPRHAPEPLQSYGASQPSYHPGPPAPQAPFAMQPGTSASYGSMDAYSRTLPPEPIQPPTRPSGATTPLSTRPSFNEKLPPLNTTFNMSSNKHTEPSSPASTVPQSGYYNTSVHTPIDSNKRGFAQVFNERHLTQPLRHGARPSSPGRGMYQPSAEVDDNDADPVQYQGLTMMEYRRADGRHMERPLQQHN